MKMVIIIKNFIQSQTSSPTIEIIKVDTKRLAKGGWFVKEKVFPSKRFPTAPFPVKCVSCSDCKPFSPE